MGILSESLDVSWRMFLSPKESFERINGMKASSCFFPFIIGIISSLLLLSFYYSNVNLGWLIDQMSLGMDNRQKIVLKDMLDRQTLWGMSSAGLVVSVLFFNCIFALYFDLVSKIINVNIDFGKWFALSMWASLPTILLLPIGVTALLLSQNGQVMPEGLNPTSLNALVFKQSPGQPWRALLESISFISLWTSFLMIIGIRVWTSVSIIRSVAIVMTPQILMYIAWAIYIIATS
jgi:Yip1 domain